MAQTIDEVIARLVEIKAASRSAAHRIGYFTSLYLKVTTCVKEGITQGRFHDGARMEALDVAFANRFIQAYDLWQNRSLTTSSWSAAFETAGLWKPLILQHLLLGINAHINLDLGIAAQQTCPGEKLLPLHPDFEMINTILAELFLPLQENMNNMSPWIGFLNSISKKTDDAVINFSMNIARNEAWQFALYLNTLNTAQKIVAIQKRDVEIAALANKVTNPKGFAINAGLMVIRLREINNVSKVIDLLG